MYSANNYALPNNDYIRLTSVEKVTNKCKPARNRPAPSKNPILAYSGNTSHNRCAAFAPAITINVLTSKAILHTPIHPAIVGTKGIFRFLIYGRALLINKKELRC